MLRSVRGRVDMVGCGFARSKCWLLLLDGPWSLGFDLGGSNVAHVCAWIGCQGASSLEAFQPDFAGMKTLHSASLLQQVYEPIGLGSLLRYGEDELPVVVVEVVSYSGPGIFHCPPAGFNAFEWKA